eukprot:493033-Prymnesium_polylepis.1
MEEAAAGFFSYDPEQWMPTLQPYPKPDTRGLLTHRETACFVLRVQSSCASGLSGTWDTDAGLHELCVKRAEPVGKGGRHTTTTY